MTKYLVFDTDNSMASIGGPEEQAKVFGYPARPITGGIPEVMNVLQHVLQQREEAVTTELDELFGPETNAPTVKRTTFSDKAHELGLGGIVIDTLSTLGYQTRAALMKKYKEHSMNLQLWGQYGDQVMRFVNLLKTLHMPVVVTCHIDRDRDENGGPIDVPGMKGGSKLEIPRFFDVVAYTYIARDPKGQSSYLWQVRADNRRIFSKDRREVTQSIHVDQNLGPIIRGYQEQGLQPKILILGDSGQGKTTSLSTINN